MTICSLEKEKCGPCHGEGTSLARAEAVELLSELEGWSLSEQGDVITRKFTFKNFVDALEFTNKIAAIAEDEGHHPDLKLGWGYVEVKLTTHNFNALTRNDFILAAKIDAI